MAKNSSGKGHRFGTAPVFLAAISTILGAILFLRFGYAVANAGLIGTLIIILVGHMITIPTALAIAEIATNLKVEGGGEYFIISRSFGSIIGGLHLLPSHQIPLTVLLNLISFAGFHMSMVLVPFFILLKVLWIKSQILRQRKLSIN